MNKIMITAVVMSFGLWMPYAYAGGYEDIDKPMTDEQLKANYCIRGQYQGGCADPIYWDIYEGWEVSDCNSWFVEPTCFECKSGYERYPYACAPDNATGNYIANCMPEQMTAEQLQYAGRLLYMCKCSDLFGETGVSGYLFRGCSEGSIEYKCDASQNYYQSGTTAPTCTVSTDTDGNFKFTRCQRCRKCDENAESWKAANTGYQRAYKKKFSATGVGSCTDYAIDKWRCASGYYGTSTNGTSGCNKCPQFENVGLTQVCNGDTCPYIKSTPGSNTVITDCFAGTYEPALDVYLKDTTGKFRWYLDDGIYGECNYK